MEWLQGKSRYLSVFAVKIFPFPLRQKSVIIHASKSREQLELAAVIYWEIETNEPIIQSHTQSRFRVIQS
jgi:hypothetical protein